MGIKDRIIFILKAIGLIVFFIYATIGDQFISIDYDVAEVYEKDVKEKPYTLEEFRELMKLPEDQRPKLNLNLDGDEDISKLDLTEFDKVFFPETK